MAGTGTFYDYDPVVAPKAPLAIKKGVTSYSGVAGAGFPLFLRGDGRLDPSVHPPLGLLASTVAPGPHLIALPDGNFENGLAAWTAATGVSSGAQPTTATVAVDGTSGNQVTGVNSIKLTTAATTDVASITSGLFPCGAGIPIEAFLRVKSSKAAARLLGTVAFFDYSKAPLTSNGTATVVSVTGVPTSFVNLGGLLVPPAGTAYGQIKAQVDIAIDSVWCDEVRLLRRPLPFRTSQVLRAARTQFLANGGTMSGFLAASIGGSDGTDGTWEAAYVEPEAPINGILYGAISSYLTTATASGGLGLGTSAAATILASIWASAPALTP